MLSVKLVSVFVAFLIAVTKHLQKQLREKRFILAHVYLRCQSIVAGVVWWNRAVHVMLASTQKKREFRKGPGQDAAPRTYPQ
jgi:hypothetical protein